MPFRYTVDDGELFAFAGLWREGRVGGERIASVTVLTTAANAVCAPVHDRMPCVLARPGRGGGVALAGRRRRRARSTCCGPLDAARTAAAPANPAVNKAGVEGPELLVVPPGDEPAQLTL